MSLEAGVAVTPTSEVGECCSASASPIPIRLLGPAGSALRDSARAICVHVLAVPGGTIRFPRAQATSGQNRSISRAILPSTTR